MRVLVRDSGQLEKESRQAAFSPGGANICVHAAHILMTS